MFVKPIENFLGAFEKKFQPKKADFQKMKLKIRLKYSDKTPYFGGLKLFSKASRKFSIGLTNMFKVSERSA